MIQEVEKQPKVALCRKCRGTGTLIVPPSMERVTCDQCRGSGRVTVSAKIIYDIRPFNPALHKQ